MQTKVVEVDNIKIGGGNPFVLIAGPCVIENEDDAVSTAEELVGITGRAGVPFIYKSSYDKANRTSISSYRGPGWRKGLRILRTVKKKFGVPVTSDVHKEDEIKYAAEVLDIIQIPAFLCRQTDILTTAADTKKIINIKKGQFLAPWDMKHVVEKIESRKNYNIMLTERGTSFGYNTLVSDFRSLPIMRRLGYPVVYDVTHSIQQPGGMGDRSGGQSEFIPYLVRAALAVGCDAVFMEVHQKPSCAPSDGPNMFNIEYLYDLLMEMKRIVTQAIPPGNTKFS